MPTIELKTWPEHFQAILDLRKTFEFRRNDRNFQVNDLLRLREYQPEISHEVLDARQIVVDQLAFYTGRQLIVRVQHIMASGFGLPDGFCIMSLDLNAVGRPIRPLSFDAKDTQIPTHTFP